MKEGGRESRARGRKRGAEGEEGVQGEDPPAEAESDEKQASPNDSGGQKPGEAALKILSQA